MIESPPKFSEANEQESIKLLVNPMYGDLFAKIDDGYYYWDKVKYMVPSGILPEVLWQAVKFKRRLNVINLKFGKLQFHFTITSKMQQLLHEFDMNFGGSLGAGGIIPEKDHKVYLLSSIMEEAIASSQMEGASTTRKVAKEMLRKQAKPINKSQQMIVNNYATIQYLVAHKDERFSLEALLNIHRLIAKETLNDSSDEGALRKDDKICVMNDITGEIVHTPPFAADLKGLLTDLCNFANDDKNEPFIHPIIKGIIIHFMLAYFHPFVDGNGRTSRSLIYWYLLKKGYWLTEFLSISRVIYKSKNQYEKSFLYVEQDELDLSYFIVYHLQAMKKAYEALQVYLRKKMKEREEYYQFRGFSNINERQGQILKIFSEKPKTLLTAKEVSIRFPITIRTARTDLQHLVELKLLAKAPINKRMVGYNRAEGFEDILKELTNL